MSSSFYLKPSDTYCLGKKRLLKILISTVLESNDFINIRYGFLLFPKQMAFENNSGCEAKAFNHSENLFFVYISHNNRDDFYYNTNQNTIKNIVSSLWVWNPCYPSFLETSSHAGGEFCRDSVWEKLLGSPAASNSSNLISLKRQWKWILW